MRSKAGGVSTWAGMGKAAEPGLTRERIVAEAIALADEEGAEALSIRRLAARLGSSAMALYHYVPTKQDLYNLMMDATSREGRPLPEDLEGWRAVLTFVAREWRAGYKRHPWTLALMATDPEMGPETLKGMESVLERMSRCGLEWGEVTGLLGTVFVFTMGFVSDEEQYRDTRPLAFRKKEGAYRPRVCQEALEAGHFPFVRLYLETGSELPGDERFERTLKWLLDGMEGDLKGR